MFFIEFPFILQENKKMRISEIIELDEAKKDLEFLSKKYKHSFKDDYKRFKTIVFSDEEFQEIERVSIKHANTRCNKKTFYKYKKFRCRELQSTSSFRVIYFIIDGIFYLVEIYCKKQKQNADYKRFKKYCELYN